MVAFECLHTIQKKTRGKSGLMAFKLDISKAYDRVEWSFLRTMFKLGFSTRWVDLVMKYISSSRFSLLLNGKPTGRIIPTRGFRQGCPLSPYLFLLCSEGLFHLLNTRVETGLPKGIKCARLSPIITHLFFADDSLIMSNMNVNNCDNIRDVLSIYATASR